MNLSHSPLKKEGILLIDKPKNKTSFYLVSSLRKITGIRKIGHAGTLDPLATGVMVMLIGGSFTKKSAHFMGHDKEYQTRILLGEARDSYDTDGLITMTSSKIPSLEEIQTALLQFQGTILQVPPMFSAKKQNGKKLYELARQGKEVERKPVSVTVGVSLLAYNYPHLELLITCSSGTYVRSIAHDLGQMIGSYGCVESLVRTRSGPFHISSCLNLDSLTPSCYEEHLIKGN